MRQHGTSRFRRRRVVRAIALHSGRDGDHIPPRTLRRRGKGRWGYDLDRVGLSWVSWPFRKVTYPQHEKSTYPISTNPQLGVRHTQHALIVVLGGHTYVYDSFQKVTPVPYSTPTKNPSKHPTPHHPPPPSHHHLGQKTPYSHTLPISTQTARGEG